MAKDPGNNHFADSQSASGGKKPTTLLGAAITLIAALAVWLGVDVVGDNSDQASSTDTSASSTQSSTSSSQKSASAKPHSPTTAQAGTASGFSASTDTCAVATLPDQALDTIEDVLAGGPYDYPADDNQRFGNYEGHLPKQRRNYYREYTVETPGLHHRGERRIVTGGGTETDPDVWYYTDDHYETFCEIPDAEYETQ